ncbi:MAG: hypothetical protein MRY78_19660, partial [Saprospiraceae bacterium]|nr:hypothetical protein [Saprospiraceae bacterium]
FDSKLYLYVVSCRAIVTRERELSVRGDNCFLLLFYELYSSNFTYTKVSIIFSPNNTMNMGYGSFFWHFFLKKAIPLLFSSVI